MRDVLTLVEERIRRGVISLLPGEHSSGKERSHAELRGSCRFSELQQSTQPVSAFGEKLANLPKAKQRGAKTQPPIHIFGLSQPLQTRAKIVVFEPETHHPFRSFRAALLRSLFFCQHQAVGGMGAFRQG